MRLLYSLMTFCILALLVVLANGGVALAQAAAPAAAPVGDGLLGGVVSLWGPLLGLLAALVLFFDRLAKVIPNSGVGGVLTVVRKVAAILGVKVPDVE